MAFFHSETPRGLIDRIYAPDCTPDRIAGFARCVLERAAKGEQTASAILERNMKRLASLAAHMIKRAPEAFRVGLYGGIFAHSPMARKLFSEALSALCPDALTGTPDLPPELGAVIHLMQAKGPVTEETLDTMKSTYEEYRHEQH